MALRVLPLFYWLLHLSIPILPHIYYLYGGNKSNCLPAHDLSYLHFPPCSTGMAGGWRGNPFNFPA